ncbi:hypothetical protein R6Q59_020523 [Mikania micrantha]
MTDSDSGSKSSKSTSSDSDSPKLVKKANSSKRRPLIIEKNAKKAKKNPASEKPKKAFIRRLEAPVISSSGSEETGSGTDSDSSLSKPNLVDSHSKSAKKSTPKATPMPDDETVILKRAIGFKAEKNDIEEIVKAGLELTDDSKRAELEEKRKALDEQELMLYMKRLEFLKNQALVALEGIRKLR